MSPDLILLAVLRIFFDSLDRRKCNDFLRSSELSPFGDFREGVFALFSADFPLQIPIPAPFGPGDVFLANRLSDHLRR